MRFTQIQRAQYMTESQGVAGVQPWRQRVPYETFKSKFGPQYKPGFNLYGWNMTKFSRFGVLAGTFGLSAGIFAVFFFDGVPRVRRDILQKVPFIGEFFVDEIAPEDNPF